MHKEDWVDYNKFYTTQDFKQFLTTRGIDSSEFSIKSFKRNIEVYDKKASNTSILRNADGEIILLKEFVEDMDWPFFKLLQKHYQQIFHNKIFIQKHYEGYVPLKIASIILECQPKTIENRVKNNSNIMNLIESNGQKMVKYEDIITWSEFRKSHIEIDEICISVIDTIEEKNRGEVRFYRDKIKELYQNGLFDKYKPVLGQNTLLPTRLTNNSIFINCKYKDEVYELLKNELTYKSLAVHGKRNDRFDLKFNKISNKDNSKNKKNTLKEFHNFTMTRFTLRSTRQQPYFDILDLIDNLDKELTLYTTEEVVALLDNLPSKRAKEEFNFFLKYLKKINPAKYTKINYNPKAGKETKPIPPYTEEQYQRFGFLVLSDSHIWYEEYMKKALSKRIYASTWLYAVLHYICAWRSGDIMNKLPRPNLRMEPQEFLNKVESKKLTKEEALDIVEQVNMRLQLWNLKPSKTKSNTSPTLVMEIPESLFEFLGTLIGIVEAHYQLSTSHNKKGLINKDANSRQTQEEFFGEEFVKIFGNKDSFTNLRAVKNYEMLISRKADEKELGTGYILASIARAHKFKLDKKATTTMVYLRYYKNMEDSEVILGELFERGVCSFVPYLLTKIVAGEEEILKLSHEERTKKMREIVDISSYESEMVIQGYNLALERAKINVDEIVSDAVHKGLEPKEIAKNILLNLIYDEASSKQDNLPCMLIAQGKPCIYKKRENCVGCGHEIYLKSCLFELGNRIEKAKNEAVTSKTQASRNKNILMIKNVLSPIVAEIFITLKDVYKIENIDEFKRLIR